MAKGNLLLGTAGNSVGDVVMYRREGAQVSRVRVRKVKNPKTAAQSTQRAFFAPVAKFYSPLSIVLERSYEGLSKSKSYSKFLKTNVDLARQKDWLLPKGTGFFPLPYKLSNGSIARTHASVNEDGQVVMDVPTAESAFANMGAVSQALVNKGYANGDVVTVIAVIEDGTNDFRPVSSQFIIDTTSTDALSALKGFQIIAALATSGELAFEPKTGGAIAGAIIVSRFENDMWRRSTEFLNVISTQMESIETPTYKKTAVASYGATNTDGNPLVYLDGEALEG